ncbi:MAG: hypothetical protein HN348_32000 [Proteobacteria bacterium]|jgi:hypothetical protein|nr:hypothetical protein [Pseudomonadota bacterium]
MIRPLLILSAFLFSASAWAQEKVWVAEDVQSMRFVNEEVVGPFFSAGDRVEVVFREAGQVRLKKGLEFGWVAEAQVTDKEPEAEETPE